MLTNKNKKDLKSIAHSKEENLITFNVGKGNIDSNFINTIQTCFTKHELIKISFLKSAIEQNEKEEMILDLLSKLHCDLVQKIGNTIIIFKQNLDLPHHIILKK